VQTHLILIKLQNNPDGLSMGLIVHCIDFVLEYLLRKVPLSFKESVRLIKCQNMSLPLKLLYFD
jgi:hypothetical protein